MSEALRIPAPSDRQWDFLHAKERYVAYGGARGGGKSWAIRTKAVLLCLNWPGIVCMIVRKTYPELEANHIKHFRKMLRTGHPNKKERLANYNDSKKEITFPNGSQILFRYCDAEKDVDRFQGTETDVLFLDESTLLSEEQITKIDACVRGTGGFPHRTYFTCNPGGKSHAWHKRLFIDRRFEGTERPEDYVFIPARVTDNYALMKADPKYIETLRALPKKLRDMWLDGSWDVFAGQFFEEFRTEPQPDKCVEAGITAEEAKLQRRWVHVIDPVDPEYGVPHGWTIMRSYDFGYNKPFSLAWWAVDYDGVLYRILELYGCTGQPNEGVRWTPDEQFRKAREIERTHPWLKGRRIRDGVADPAIWDASRGESIAETAERYGIYFQKGDHERMAGWMQCHYRLQFDENGYPRCYIFRNCEAFIRTIPLLLYDETHPEDLDTEGEDHVADEWRYLCMTRPVKPVLPAKEKQLVFDPLDQIKAGDANYRAYRGG